MYKKTTNEFIVESNVIHNKKYVYDKCDYINSHTKVTIICPEHGEFEQKPYIHLQKHGCPKCASNKVRESQRMGKKSFVKKARQIHGNKYDYSKVKYVSRQTKVIIICPEHGEFEQTPNNHLHYGCNQCGYSQSSKKLRWSLEQFIENCKRIHGNKYNYSKTKYINNNSKIVIICPQHGEFIQTAGSHVNGVGCSACAGVKPYTTTSFIEKAKQIHGNKYDYTNIKYKNSITPVIIGCRKHGDFLQLPVIHLVGSGCPICKESKGEMKIRRYLKNECIKFIPQYRINDCRNKHPLPFDFAIEYDELHLIEYQGRQHYEPTGFGGNSQDVFCQTKQHDEIKREYCEKNKIPFLIIPYWNFDKIEQLLEEFLK